MKKKLNPTPGQALKLGLSLSVLLGMLSACFPPQPHPGAHVISEPKKNYLRQESKICHLTFAQDKATLTEASKGKLRASLKPLRHEGGRYRASIHASYPENLEASKRQALQKFLEEGGLKSSQIHSSSFLKEPKKTEKDGHSTTEITVKLDYYLVVPPTCGKWDYGLGYADGTIAPANFGCATTRNHALQVADPIVFFQGQDRDLPDGEFSALAVNNYRGSIKKNTSQGVGPNSGPGNGPGGPGGNQNGLVGSGSNLGGAAGNLAQQTVGSQANASGNMLSSAVGGGGGAPLPGQ